MVVDMMVRKRLTTGDTGKTRGAQINSAASFALMEQGWRRGVENRIKRFFPVFPVPSVVKMFLPGLLFLTFAMRLPVAAADNLPDPTRPSAEMGAAAGSPGVASGPVLQSVLISRSRKSAIIGGQTVGLGEKYGDARVVRITEKEVVLKTGSATETLRLFPDVEKRPSRAVASDKAQAGRLVQGEAK
ncbi:MAG: hypothetical protein PHX38_07930 [Sulfuricella sp.]|nr:hypothetical protein [Sulfuricella sp.]